jgi:hypothetical protein
MPLGLTSKIRTVMKCISGAGHFDALPAIGHHFKRRLRPGVLQASKINQRQGCIIYLN